MVNGQYAKIEEELARHGVHYSTTVGDSMAPMLRQRRNTVVLRTPKGRAKRYDVILFLRPDGRYVLHRVIRVTEDGYITRGDNRRQNDAPVPEEQLLAVMDGYYKKKKYISPTSLRYRIYVALWGRPNFLRYLYHSARDLARRILGKRPKG